MTEKEYYIRPRSSVAMLPEEESAPKKHEKKSRIGLPRERYIVAAGGLAAVALVGGAGQYMADDPGYLPIGFTEMLLDYDCMNVTEAVSARVHSVLNSPNDPEFIDLLINAPDLNISIHDVPGYKEYQMRRASELGLTILDPEESLQRLEEADSKSEVINSLNNFSKNYGFKFEIFKDGDLKSMRDYKQNFSGLKESDLDTDLLKTSSSEIIKTLSDTPVELGRLSNIHRVLIARNIDNESEDLKGKTLAKADSKVSSIYLDLEILKRPGYIGTVFLHELSHGIDGTVCGKFGYLNDVQFNMLNPSEFNYQNDYSSSEKSLYVLTSYSNKNIVEDKAELMEQMITGLVDINTLDPVVKNKYILELSRLEENIPGISSYLRSVSVFSSVNDVS